MTGLTLELSCLVGIHHHGREPDATGQAEDTANLFQQRRAAGRETGQRNGGQPPEPYAHSAITGCAERDSHVAALKMRSTNINVYQSVTQV
eukprot:6427622-Prymnesium_polylepis.1